MYIKRKVDRTYFVRPIRKLNSKPSNYSSNTGIKGRCYVQMTSPSESVASLQESSTRLFYIPEMATCGSRRAGCFSKVDILVLPHLSNLYDVSKLMCKLCQPRSAIPHHFFIPPWVIIITHLLNNFEFIYYFYLLALNLY